MKNLTKFLVSLLFFACEQSKRPPFALPENARSLLTNDSSKTWKLARRFNNDTRMNMGDCFLSYRLSFNSDMTLMDNNGEQRDCGETLNAEWKFTKNKEGYYYLKWTSEQLPTLLNIESNDKYFKILDLSEDQLVLQFYHKQFSSKKTQITDIYVPNDASVNQEFHW